MAAHPRVARRCGIDGSGTVRAEAVCHSLDAFCDALDGIDVQDPDASWPPLAARPGERMAACIANALNFATDAGTGATGVRAASCAADVLHAAFTISSKAARHPRAGQGNSSCHGSERVEQLQTGGAPWLAEGVAQLTAALTVVVSSMRQSGGSAPGELVAPCELNDAMEAITNAICACSTVPRYCDELLRCRGGMGSVVRTMAWLAAAPGQREACSTAVEVIGNAVARLAATGVSSSVTSWLSRLAAWWLGACQRWSVAMPRHRDGTVARGPAWEVVADVAGQLADLLTSGREDVVSALVEAFREAVSSGPSAAVARARALEQWRAKPVPSESHARQPAPARLAAGIQRLTPLVCMVARDVPPLAPGAPTPSGAGAGAMDDAIATLRRHCVDHPQFRRRFWERHPCLFPSCLLPDQAAAILSESALWSILHRGASIPSIGREEPAEAWLAAHAAAVDLWIRQGDRCCEAGGSTASGAGVASSVPRAPTALRQGHDVNVVRSSVTRVSEAVHQVTFGAPAGRAVSGPELERLFSQGFSIAMRQANLRCDRGGASGVLECCGAHTTTGAVTTHLYRHAPVARACTAVGHSLGQWLSANVYLTPPNARGLAPHTDDHCVFVCQVSADI